MKKFTTILISCSLALAVGAMAQEEEASQPPKKKQAESKHPAKEVRPAKDAKPANQAKPESARKEHAATKAPGQTKGAPEPQSTSESPAATNAGKDAPANGKQQAEQSKKKEHNAPNAPATANKPAAPTPASASAPSQAPAAPQATKPNQQPNKVNAQAKKPDPQAVQAIKAQHANFRAQPKPEQVPAVTFNQSYRIQGADQWQGSQYEVFRSYRPEIHDQGWYRSRYNRVELIGGGYYYWNAGYWYPAWGYDRAAQYYAYDGPIYVGSRAEPPDRVIADVQATLQQQGYYKGEVDGLLGPLTREALTAYQSDNGLFTTATIDEPTLSSLGMG